MLAIEAKPLQTDLTDKHAAQLVQYCSVEGIEWSVLTNARALWLFNTFLKGDQNQKLVVKLDLLGFNTDAEFELIFDQLWLLSKQSLSSPSAINSWMEQRRLDQGARTVLLNQHSATIQALVAELGRVAGVTASADTVVQWVRGQLAPSVSVLPVTATAVPAYEPESQAEPGGPRYWMVPCGPAKDGAKALEQLRRWIDRGYWGFYKSTPGRVHLRTGDYICFYANRAGVAATARIAGRADTVVSSAEWPEPYAMDKDVYKVPLKDISWLPSPRPITRDVRARLDAFRGRDLNANPGWLVQTTHSLTAHDFEVLTARTAA